MQKKKTYIGHVSKAERTRVRFEKSDGSIEYFSVHRLVKSNTRSFYEEFSKNIDSIIN
jgi:hypothetical protein